MYTNLGFGSILWATDLYKYQPVEKQTKTMIQKKEKFTTTEKHIFNLERRKVTVYIVRKTN